MRGGKSRGGGGLDFGDGSGGGGVELGAVARGGCIELREEFAGVGEVLVRRRRQLAKLGGGMRDLVGGGGEVLAFGSAECDESFFEGFAGSGSIAGEAGGEFGDGSLKLSGELLGLLEIFLREGGDLVETGSSDTDLFGRGGENMGEGFEGTLTVVEGFVFLGFVADDERHKSSEGAEQDEDGDDKNCLRGKRLRRVVGEKSGGGEQHGVGEKENPEGKFRGV